MIRVLSIVRELAIINGAIKRRKSAALIFSVGCSQLLDKVFDDSGHDDANNSGYTEIHNSSQKHNRYDTRDATSLTEM
jgi:hypothetical protein